MLGFKQKHLRFFVRYKVIIAVLRQNVLRFNNTMHKSNVENHLFKTK